MKLILVAAALLLPASTSPDPAQPPQPETRSPTTHLPSPRGAEETFRMPNAYSPGGADCLPLGQQVEAQKRRLNRADGHTLDREPMAFGFHAVDRNVGGCREVTFLRGNAPAANRQQAPAR